jgi:hypothetical protein
MPTFAQNVDNPTSCNNFLTTILLSNNVEIAQCYFACLLCATMIYVFNSIVGERRSLLLMKYKTNDTFFLRDVDMLQLNSYSFHTMVSDLDLGNHHLFEVQVLWTSNASTHWLAAHSRTCHLCAIHIRRGYQGLLIQHFSQELQVDLRDKRRLNYIWCNM